jgi:hypothetical protein
MLRKQPHDFERLLCVDCDWIFWEATSIRTMTDDKSITGKYNCLYFRHVTSNYWMINECERIWKEEAVTSVFVERT